MPKTRRTPKPAKPPVQPLGSSAVTAIAPIVSVEQQTLIGQVIVASSKLENAMQDTVWHFLRIEMGDGRIITEQMPASTVLRILRALANRHLDEPLLHEFLVIMDKIEDAQEDRNFIAHGTWGTALPMQEPMAMSLRPKAEPGTVMSETFPRGRMLAIVRQLSEALQFLVDLMARLETLPRKSDGAPA